MNQHPSIRRIRTTGFLYVWFAHPPFGIHTTGFLYVWLRFMRPGGCFIYMKVCPDKETQVFAQSFCSGKKIYKTKKEH